MHELAADTILFAQFSPTQTRDLLVTLIAIGLGLNIVHAAVFNYSKCMELGSVQTMDASLGRPATRIILYCIGGLCLLMGVYLVGQATLQRKTASSDSGVKKLMTTEIAGVAGN